MRKKVKKLMLAKETVRKLENGQLAEAAGGWVTYSCDFDHGPRICQIVLDTDGC